MKQSLGDWKNVSRCATVRRDRHKKQCGIGVIEQNRTCTPGLDEKCNPDENARFIECSLPDCPGNQNCFSFLIKM